MPSIRLPVAVAAQEFREMGDRVAVAELGIGPRLVADLLPLSILGGEARGGVNSSRSSGSVGDYWCPCAARGKEPADANCTPVVLVATNGEALKVVTLEELRAHTIEMAFPDWAAARG